MYLDHKQRSAAAFVGSLFTLAAPAALAAPGQTADQKAGAAPSASAPPASEKAPAPAQAQALVDAAVRTARASGRTVLVHFGASW
uniref:Uncharacterized protein n=1 Tax=uncultured Armatimonadetes bacterium TaxID=157466 RepID=A0A6J4K6G1_9BACT|nr:hypothetical protein AVDCRST_MAG63-5105 [uncultured Armatimonadetes bacterium]